MVVAAPRACLLNAHLDASESGNTRATLALSGGDLTKLGQAYLSRAVRLPTEDWSSAFRPYIKDDSFGDVSPIRDTIL